MGAAVTGAGSDTVTVAVQVDVFPAPSVTSKVTESPPIFEQVNAEGVTEVAVGVPQLSVEALFTCVAVMLALFALIVAVTFWQIATGGVDSLFRLTVAVVSCGLRHLYRKARY